MIPVVFNIPIEASFYLLDKKSMGKQKHKHINYIRRIKKSWNLKAKKLCSSERKMSITIH